MKDRMQTQTVPRRNLFTAMEEVAKGSLPTPAVEYVTRKEIEALEQRITEKLQSAVQQVAQQQPLAPSRTPKQDSMLERMRSMAD